jgi:uncharacterized protein
MIIARFYPIQYDKSMAGGSRMPEISHPLVMSSVSLYNSCMAELFKLYRIQQLDTQMDQARQRISDIHRILEDKTERQAADIALAEAEQELEQLRKEQKSVENLVNAQKIKIQQNQAALYGGKVKNPKELQSLESEAAALQRYLTSLEDQLIEAMIAVEHSESIYQTTSDHHRQVYAAFQELKTRLLAEGITLKQQIDRLTTEKATIAQTIPPDELMYYEELRIKRKGIAVAKITDSFCSACGSRLNASLIHTAKITQSIARCDTCGRILYAG